MYQLLSSFSGDVFDWSHAFRPLRHFDLGSDAPAQNCGSPPTAGFGTYPRISKTAVSRLEARSIVGSDRHIMTRRLRGRPPPLVVDLCGRNVAMAQEFLHLGDVYAGIEQ